MFFSVHLLPFRTCGHIPVVPSPMQWSKSIYFEFGDGGRFRVIVNLRRVHPIQVSLWISILCLLKCKRLQLINTINGQNKRIPYVSIITFSSKCFAIIDVVANSIFNTSFFNKHTSITKYVQQSYPRSVSQAI